jgi:hypothetical protein
VLVDAATRYLARDWHAAKAGVRSKPLDRATQAADLRLYVEPPIGIEPLCVCALTATWSRDALIALAGVPESS